MGEARKIVEKMWELMESGQVERFPEVVGPDTKMVMTDGTVIRGPAEIAGLRTMWWTAMPDLRHEIVDAVEHGDTIAVELAISGTHTGPMASPKGAIPPTGKKVTLHSVDFIHTRGGRVVSWHAYFDQLTLMAQLGVMPEESGDSGQALVRRFGLEIINEGRLDLVPQVFAPDCRYHLPGMPEFDTVGHNQLIASFRESFPDARIAVEEMFTAGDRVVTRFTYTGTHTGAPFQGLPTSRRSFRIEGINIDRIARGRIAEHWGYADFLGLMQQLGAIPSP